MTARTNAKPADTRPYRRMSEACHEEIAVIAGKIRNTYRQVGWIGQTGAFYAFDEKPSETEPGPFAPLWFVAFSERLDGDEKTPGATDKVRDVHEVQGRDGNWNYSEGMRGMFNGLELALSILELEREPQYRSEPEGGYLCDRPTPDTSGPEFAPVPAEG